MADETEWPTFKEGAAEAAKLREREIEARTREDYERQRRTFDGWRGKEPVVDRTVAAYVGALALRGLAPASAKQAVAAIAWGAKEDGLPCPVGPMTRTTMRGYRRVHAKLGKGQADGVARADAQRMAREAESGGGAGGLRDALLISLCHDCLLRSDEARALDVRDLTFKNNGLRVLIRRSKTDPECRGAVQAATPETARRLRRWLEASGIESGPVFRPVNKAGAVGEGRLTTRGMRSVVGKRAEAAGVEGRVTMHSLRIGAAQSLMEDGASLAELMRAGRWKSSSMVALYTRGQAAERGATARLWGGAEARTARREAA